MAHDVSVAFRISDIIEVYTFNERQTREKQAQKALLKVPNPQSSPTRTRLSAPSTHVLQQAFPEHRLSTALSCRDEHMWGAVLQAVSTMGHVNPDQLTSAVSMMLSETAPLPHAFTARDAVGASIAAGLLCYYARDESKPGSPDARRARASVLTLASPYDGGNTCIGPTHEEVLELDGGGDLRTCGALRCAKMLFGGAYLAWVSDKPDTAILQWRNALMYFFDLLPTPTGSLGNGFDDRCVLRAARDRPRIELPARFAPGYRGAHLCTKETVLSILCVFEDRVLVQPEGAVEDGEFGLGRQRAELLKRLHPAAGLARVVVAVEPIFDDLPSFDVKEEMAAHGWLAPFRLARKNGVAVTFDDWVHVVSVGDVEWSAKPEMRSGKGVLDRYTLFIILAMLFDAEVEGADDDLRSIVEKCPRPYRALMLRLPDDGIRPEIKYASRYLRESY